MTKKINTEETHFQYQPYKLKVNCIPLNFLIARKQVT